MDRVRFAHCVQNGRLSAGAVPIFQKVEVTLGSDEDRTLAESIGSAQRIVFAPDLLMASAVAGAWGYHFITDFLAGTGPWYAMPLALLLGSMTLFFAVASIRVWTRRVGWVRWLAAGWLLWSLFGLCLRFLLEK